VRVRAVNSDQSRPPQLPTIFDRYDWLEETRQNTAKVLQFVDEVGSWNIASSLTVLGIFVLESYTQVELTEMMNSGFMPMELDITLNDLNVIESTINTILILEYFVRFFASGFNFRYLATPFALVDLLALTPALLPALGVSGNIIVYTRTLRILRLLRLTDTSGQFFLFKGAGEVTVKLYEIFVEFFCIFITTAAIVYNIEHEVNLEFGDLGDSLYWSFLTLTGNEQPFDVITARGRLAAVSAYTIAIAVVPGQLARLLATIGDQMMSEKQGSMNNNGFANANSWNTPGSASSTKNSGKGLLANILNVATSTRPSGSNDSLESDIPVDPFTPDLNEKLPSRVLGWGNPEVVEWLVQMNLGQYKRAFQRARVDGETLLRFVDDTALREDFGVVFRVHRNKIMYNIALLKSMK